MPKLELSKKSITFTNKVDEHFNALRTNIQLSGNQIKVIAITSVQPGKYQWHLLFQIQKT